MVERPLAYRLVQAPFAAAKFDPVRRHNDLARAERVLDVGCGPGTNADCFRDADYVGIDINPRYVADARRRHSGRFAVADATEYVPDDDARYDFILVNSVLHHLPAGDVNHVLSRLRELLAEGGCVHILELLLPERASVAGLLARLDRGDHARPLREWRELFEAVFTPVTLEPYRVGVAGVTLWNMVYFKGCAA